MSSDYSATDIITFIGVPLAVLGVLPILYNTIATLAALSRVRRMLKKSRLAGNISCLYYTGQNQLTRMNRNNKRRHH